MPTMASLTTPGTTVDTVVSLCKRRGFVYPSGEIYGGTRSAWDYGPLGVELKDNIKRQWWKSMVIQRDDVVGLDSAIILPRETWVTHITCDHLFTAIRGVPFERVMQHERLVRP